MAPWGRELTKTPMDTQTLLRTALKEGVGFMPGELFYASHPERHLGHMRLAFSHASEADAEKGLRILSHLLRTGQASKA